jgi:curved DNA-binding protein CbpA
VRDYYAILGVQRSATQAEVKAAYVRLSKALHPDVNPNGAALMQVVNEAYETLGDPAKRSIYDRGEKVRNIVPPTQQAGTIDLTKLAQAFMPANLYGAAGPSFERLLEERGITPQAASVEQLLESCGVLKRKRKGARKSA